MSEFFLSLLNTDGHAVDLDQRLIPQFSPKVTGPNLMYTLAVAGIASQTSRLEAKQCFLCGDIVTESSILQRVQ